MRAPNDAPAPAPATAPGHEERADPEGPPVRDAAFGSRTRATRAVAAAAATAEFR